MKKKYVLIIVLAAIVFIAAGYFVIADIEFNKPPEINVLSVSLTGTGSLIDVRYQTNKPITEQLNGSNVYLIDHTTGKMLGVAGVAKIGALISRSSENT